MVGSEKQAAYTQVGVDRQVLAQLVVDAPSMTSALKLLFKLNWKPLLVQQGTPRLGCLEKGG